MTTKRHKHLVFVDLDGTLLTGLSSEVRFFYYLIRHRQINAYHMYHYLVFGLRYSIQFGRNVWKKNSAYLNGLDTQHIARLAKKFVETELDRSYSATILERIAEHQNSGDNIILLTGAPSFIASAVASSINVNHYISRDCAERNGKFISSLPGRHPYGIEKLYIAIQKCKELRLQNSHMVAYANHHTDAPLLRFAHQAIAVNPDKRLAATASDAGWEIICH